MKAAKLLPTLLLAIALAMLAAPVTALAAGVHRHPAARKRHHKRHRKPKKVLVSFDEDLVQGSMTGAELFMIMQKKQSNFGSLFELRKNFIPEMYQNVESMR